MKQLTKAALIRALYTVCESLVSTLPIGFVITPAMIQSFDWSFLYVVIAWVGTALLAGFFAFLRAIVAGLPEVEDEFDDIWLEDDEVEEFNEDWLENEEFEEEDLDDEDK